MNISGIYRIKNIITEDFYIGSSKNIYKRWIQHKTQLKHNKHHSIILQRAWNKYGEKNFNLDILEECDPIFLLIKEQEYLNDHPIYNIGKVANGGDNLTNNPNRNEIINRIKTTLKNYYLNLSEKEKLKYSESIRGENNPNWNNSWTNEMKNEQSKKLKKFFETNTNHISGKTYIEYFGEEKAAEIKKKISEYASLRIGEKNSFFGKTHSKETKDNLAKNRIGKYYGEQNIPFLIDNIEYKSLGEASKFLNIHITTIRWRLKSVNQKFSNYHYI